MRFHLSSSIAPLLAALMLISVSLTGCGEEEPDMSGFRNAAETATSQYNNRNLKCSYYLKEFTTFLLSNKSKYNVTDYKFLEIKSYRKLPIAFEDYKGGQVSISNNGYHYIAKVHGVIFDNHNPHGLDADEYWPKLVLSGEKPEIRSISSSQVLRMNTQQQC